MPPEAPRTTTEDAPVNPSSFDSAVIVPPLEYQDACDHHEGENAKIAIRNIRRDANHHAKDLLKEKAVSEDEERRAETEIQQITDSHVNKVDQIVAEKEKELLEI